LDTQIAAGEGSHGRQQYIHFSFRGHRREHELETQRHSREGGVGCNDTVNAQAAETRVHFASSRAPHGSRTFFHEAHQLLHLHACQPGQARSNRCGEAHWRVVESLVSSAEPIQIVSVNKPVSTASTGSERSSPVVSLHDLTAGYPAAVAAGLEEAGFFRTVASGTKVFLKPNLTFPIYRPGVMTSYECLKAVTELLAARGYQVIIGEADSGGYNRFSIDEVFKGMGIDQLAKETGAQLVNVSFTKPEWMEVQAGGRKLRVPVPELLLREIGAFITLPVPKVHLNTGVSMSIKNQWGCIQEPSERLKLHPYFAEVMYELNSRLPHAYSIIDGKIGLNRSGPMLGDPVELNWLMVSNDLVAADRVCCRLMQLDEERIGFLRYFRKRGWWTSFESIQVRPDWERFRKIQFYLERKWTDLPGFVCFNNSFLAWLGYRSPLAGFAHWLLYLFREPFYDYDKEKSKVRLKKN